MENKLPTERLVRPLPAHLVQGGDLSIGSFDSLGQDQNRLFEYWRTIYKYRYVVGTSLLVALLGGIIYCFTATPLYTAQSKISISSYEPVLTATKIEDLIQQKSKESTYLETQLDQLGSFSLADKILSDKQISDAIEGKRLRSGLFSWMYADEPKTKALSDSTVYKHSLATIKRYLSNISITPVRRTSLAVLNATTDNPDLSAYIANKHAETYIEWVRDLRINQQASGLKFLNQQAEELREKVADLEREMADYAEENSIVALNKDENITVQKMAQLNQLLTSATAKRIENENIYNEAEAALANPSAGYDDFSTQGIRSELAKLEAEYGEMSAKFTDSYPRMKQLKAQIEELRSSVQKARKQIVLGLKSKALASAEEEKNLKEELEQQKSQAFELSKRQVQYNVLNRDLTSSRELLQNVLRQIKETSLAVESNASNISIVDFAAVPETASFPRKRLILLGAVFFGLGIGAGLAFLLAYVDSTVRTPEQLHALLRLPCLGVVPSFSLEQVLLDGPQQSSGDNATGEPVQPSEPGVPSLLENRNEVALFNRAPKSLASEAYRSIRTGILLSQAGQPPKTILITSAQSAEGKTTLSANLAAALASSGGTVVLVDGDLRKPSVRKHFGIDADRPGLVEALTGQASLDEILITDCMKNCSIITSGRIPPNPAELLGSMELASLLDELAKRFDYVLIDSPPVLPVTDSVVLSRLVDGVVMVLKGGATPQAVARDAKQRLISVGARILGVVLNDVDIRGGDYYHYNRYYYYYYNPSETGRKRKRAAGGAA